jgi:hypothetical protein
MIPVPPPSISNRRSCKEEEKKIIKEGEQTEKEIRKERRKRELSQDQSKTGFASPIQICP